MDTPGQRALNRWNTSPNKSGEKPSTLIVVSGNMYYSPTYSERARKAGAKGLFSKPFKKEELLALI